jgi:hypothetical protein
MKLKMNGGDHRTYSRFYCAFMNLVDPRAWCDHGCRWYAPFGFCVNADCPDHD